MTNLFDTQQILSVKMIVEYLNCIFLLSSLLLIAYLKCIDLTGDVISFKILPAQTRSSKDECGTNDQTIILGLQIFLDHTGWFF